MNIKVYNDSELIYQGNALKFLEDNQYDTDVCRMIRETYHQGSCHEFWSSGEWLIIKEEQERGI